jgi:hypothetical protein
MDGDMRKVLELWDSISDWVFLSLMLVVAMVGLIGFALRAHDQMGLG